LKKMKSSLESSSLPSEDRKKLRNAYTKAIRRAKKTYERKQAKKLKGGVWGVLNRKGRNSDTDWNIEANGVITTDSSQIAETFRNIFVNKIDELKTPSSPEQLVQVVPQSDHSWDLEPTSPEDVASVIRKLKSTLSCGPNKIPSRLLKELIHEVTMPITILVNRCIEEGHFPSCFKTGKVIPVFKSGSRKNPKNYRPITITSVVGKVIECVIYEQLTRHIDPLLPSTMFGFRKNTGTDDALVKLTDDIKERRLRGEVVAALVCDASSAFDLLCRRTTVSMLKRLGGGKSITSLIESFLADTKQYVIIKDKVSEEWGQDVGSGQGHVLSPPLFNIGTLSQYFWTEKSTLNGYANDEFDVISAPTTAECNLKIQEVMAARQKWYELSGMALNISKTSLMGFGFTPDPLHIGAIKINPVSQIKFLGLTIQHNFGLELHVKAITDKIRIAASNIRSEGYYFTESDRKLLYMGWVQGTLCSNATAYLPLINNQQLESIQTACNAAIRSVARLPRKSADISITSVRNHLKLMSVEDIAEKQILMYAWKNRNNFQNVDTLGPTTRARSQGNIPHPVQKGIAGKMVSTLAACAFNKLPLELKLESKASIVKANIKKMFM